VTDHHILLFQPQQPSATSATATGSASSPAAT
jgi:hypothetical protein